MYLNKILLAGCATLALAACDSTATTDVLPGFGTSVNMNRAVQVGYAVSGPSFEELSTRFTSQTDDTINFEFNSASLTPQAQVTLEQQAAWLRGTPQARLRVEGHTDRVGGENFNLQLGLRRAEAAVGYLVSRGVQRERLDAIATFGEQLPVVDTAQPEMLNRRAVTRVAGIAIELAGGEFDGKRADRIYEAYVDRAVTTLQIGGGGGGGAANQ
jgi:outer membrane protein OmpA-like peptidoglycan-associated protein